MPRTLEETRQELSKQYGLEMDSLAGMNRKELKELHESLIGFAGDIKDIANTLKEKYPPTEKKTKKTKKTKKNKQETKIVIDNQEFDVVEIPSMASLEWTPYIMSLLDKSELERGNPKTEGLRRVALIVFGLFNSETEVLQCPCAQNGARAVVKVRLTFSRFDGGGVLVSEGAADVCNLNTEAKFAVHAVATAETRAEGRALRKALCLTKILTAEELQSPDSTLSDNAGVIASESMIEGYKRMCQKHGVDPFKLAITHQSDLEDLAFIKVEAVRKLVDEINKFDNGEKEIPENVKSN